MKVPRKIEIQRIDQMGVLRSSGWEWTIRYDDALPSSGQCLHLQDAFKAVVVDLNKKEKP